MFRVLLCIGADHDWRLVLVAAFVCVAAMAATIFLHGKTPPAPGWRRWGWLWMVGLVAGSGIWTTHFVAMLAFRTGLPTGYVLGPTVGSLVVAILSVTAGLALGSTPRTGFAATVTALIGGVLFGLGVTLMHYLGMAGYRTAGTVGWDLGYVAASVLIGTTLSALALALDRPGASLGRKLCAVALLTAAIVGMHFTGMTAVTILPDSTVGVPPSDISNSVMASVAVGMTGLILLTAVLGSAFDGAMRNGNLRRLREALDAMPDGIAFFDANDRLVAWNTKYHDLSASRNAPPFEGLSFTEMLERGIDSGAIPDAIGREAAWLEERLAVRAGSRPDMIQRTGDGCWLKISERRTADGGVISHCIDVTEQRRAQLAVAESEERFRRLAVNAPDMIAESTLDGVVTYVSPACLSVTGFTPEEIVGRPFAELMEPEGAARLQAMCRTVFESRGRIAPWPVEFRARHKSGVPLWLECKPSFATDPATGRYIGLTDVIRDITPRKALEEQLRAAQAEAEAAAAVKAEFLANMSHELRTPLTSILGFTGLATAEAGLGEPVRTYVARVADASQALLCTVNDILDFSKLEAGQVAIHPKPVRFASLSRSALGLFTPQAGAKGLTLTLDDQVGDEPALALDPDRIRQILLNLVGNAVKFTAAGGVTLRTRYDRDQATVRVEVVDTGDGVPAEKRDRLFQRFSQIEGSLTRQGGTGLGLAICKGLAEAMGGRIGVDSEVGKGSRFWFEIPAPVAEIGAPGAAAPGARARLRCEGVRVLLADDHPANRELARVHLTLAGAEMTEAVDGEDAVRLASEGPFDAILMDLRMPRLDGLEAMKRVRASRGPNAATPIFAFTADSGDGLSANLMAQGFDGVIAKPLAPTQLIAAIAGAAALAAPAPVARRDGAA